MSKQNNSFNFLIVGLLAVVSFLLYQNLNSKNASNSPSTSQIEESFQTFQNLAQVNQATTDQNTSNGPTETSQTTQPTQAFSTLAGTVVFTGLKPDPGDKGELKLEYRVKGTEGFENPNLILPLVNNAPFQADKVIAGEAYDVRAYLEIDGKRVVTGQPVTVSAPASEIQLPLQVTWDNLPDEVVQEYPAQIKGTIKVNGYIPQNSTVQVLYKRRNNSDAEFVSGVNNLTARQLVEYTMDGAMNGREYQVYAELISNNQVVGKSSNSKTAAPAENLELVINSNAKAPEIKVKINGYITVNGLVNSGKPAEVYLRDLVTNEVKTIASLKPATDTWWSYDNAISGRDYKINARVVSKSGEEVFAKSVTFTAPSQSINLVMDTGSYLEEPDNRPELISCTKVKDKTYKAEVRFKDVKKAQRYWLEVGTDRGLNDIYDSVQVGPRKAEDLEISFDIREDKDYFARYAYSDCLDCGRLESFSDFSNTLKFRCPKK